MTEKNISYLNAIKYFRFWFIFYVTTATTPLLKKVTPLFPSNPPYKLRSCQVAADNILTTTTLINLHGLVILCFPFPVIYVHYVTQVLNFKIWDMRIIGLFFTKFTFEVNLVILAFHSQDGKG